MTSMGAITASVSGGILHVDVPVRRKRHFGNSSEASRPRSTTSGASSDSIFPSGRPGQSSPSVQRLDRSPSIELLDVKSDTKRVVAEVAVQADLETLWDVLTDYEALPSYVPNLEKCEILGRQKGRVRLRQVGCSQSLLWRLEAEAVLEIDEIKKSSLRREVRFRCLRGDFDRFEGCWILESDVSSSAHMTTFLRYELSATPVSSLPSQIVSYVIKAGLPSNIRAIVGVAERRAANKLKAPVVSLESNDVGVLEAYGDIAGKNEYNQVDGYTRYGGNGGNGGNGGTILGSLPQKGPFWSLRGSKYREAAPITGDIQQQIRRSEQASGRGAGRGAAMGGRGNGGTRRSDAAGAMMGTDYLGTTFVPLPPSAPPTTPAGVSSSQRAPKSLDGLSTEPSTGPSGWSSPRSNNGIEVHLRRLDGLDYIHRRAIAAIRVNAPASVVWDVITDYNRLHEFVPALVASERIQLPRNAPNVKRIRQVAYKNMGYMCLHAESVMDLVERPYSELQFRQVAGDVQLLQGKWMISEGLSTDEDYVGPSADLKYAVEIILPSRTPVISVVEPLLEGIFFEDLPQNLLSVKSEIERVAAANRPGRTSAGKPRLAEMMRDFSVLQAELEASRYSGTRTIPTRKELRADGRSDLDKSISAHGGRAQVAARMGWATSGRVRKPRGFWTLDNLKRELDSFLISSDLPPDIMPTKATIVERGRFDLVKAIEKFGGVSEVALQLGYVTSSGSGSSSASSSGSYGSSLASGEYMLSSGEFEDLMYVELDERGFDVGGFDERGFDERKEEEEMRLLDREGTQDGGRFSSAREEIDGW